MRYYIYLDRTFLRTLFSVVEDTGFNIEVMEYSVRKGCSINNQISLDPCLEKVCESGNEKSYHEDKEKNLHDRSVNLNKEKVGAAFGHSKSSHCETERRYLNIEDITNMKNTKFYHELVEKIRNNTRSDLNRICEEDGFIELYDMRGKELNNSNMFFRVNDTCIWYDKSNLEGDIELLHTMSCKVKTIAYTMNCLDSKQGKIAKAIAIFIE